MTLRVEVLSHQYVNDLPPSSLFICNKIKTWSLSRYVSETAVKSSTFTSVINVKLYTLHYSDLFTNDLCMSVNC